MKQCLGPNIAIKKLWLGGRGVVLTILDHFTLSIYIKHFLSLFFFLNRYWGFGDTLDVPTKTTYPKDEEPQTKQGTLL